MKKFHGERVEGSGIGKLRVRWGIWGLVEVEILFRQGPESSIAPR
jgi:hypothetical protein